MFLNIPLVTAQGDALSSVAVLHTVLLHLRVPDVIDLRIIGTADNRKPRILTVEVGVETLSEKHGPRDLIVRTHDLPWLAEFGGKWALPPRLWQPTSAYPGVLLATELDPREFWFPDGRTLGVTRLPRPEQPLVASPPLELRLETPEEARQRLADAHTRQSAAPNDSAVTPRPATNYQ